MIEPVNLIAATAFGLEAILKRELADLGYAGEVVSPGRVRFSGDAAAICRANVFLRTADRVLIEVASFPAADFDALFESTKSLPWTEWIPRDGAFPVIGRSLKSQLSSVPACQRAVKRAIVDSLLAGYQTTELPETGSLYKIEIALLKDVATLTLDTTGPSLHKRGYRARGNLAPLKETLAAALVLLSFWKRERPLIDPFCGSGTIAIEAAMIGRQMAPGANREFAAEKWSRIRSEFWEEARSDAGARVEPPLEERIFGGDVDGRALSIARDNARLAGVADDIHFQQRDFADLTSKRRHGCIITNPPYGQRLGERRALEPLYASFPEVLRRLPTWSHFILTAFPNFESTIQKEANRRRKLYNGRIECTYFQFHGPQARRAIPADDAEAGGEEAGAESVGSAEEGAETERTPKPRVTTPVFGGLTPKAREQADLFRARLTKRSRHLRRWPTRRGVSCFRLYERDIPEIPLVVDRYEDYLHIAEYERPHDRDLAQHADWLDLLVHTAAEALEIDRQKVFFKSRRRQRGNLQHERVAEDRCEVTVSEGGLKFLINLSDYVDTGLFLDHRQTRALVRDECSQAQMVNLFGYTGSFSVYAAAGGAAGTMTVDWSNTYIQWAQRNMALNEFAGDEHAFLKCDARTFVAQFPESNYFDIAVVDPPTYSNSKRTELDWDVQRDHAELLNHLLPLMKVGGVIYFSTNFRRIKFDEAALRGVAVREISFQTVPEDFRNRRIHRCWRLVRES
ncbi:MAG: bifunctional 23S rRNA (guanine(2069)-N(7))-methyltransferase RlmK/23S rRNA (guanine(2445)-N(2))-methyltransferase RlmL [Pirellulaceae bacterium]|nr:bifunctional 23S rRNA (guanine(2069)-N(7))-methyltransferase RlmK/23S rRNA (guanine(2445)-N(2))-methyltransferase RlmL [Pirellulaceae bacterium]